MDGLPVHFFREFIEFNGGVGVFEGLTTTIVKRMFIKPKTESTKLSLCAQMRQEGDQRVQPATWFVSHAWQYRFMDVVEALEAFFVDKPDTIIWMDLFSTSQHSTFDRPPEWWQQTFCSAIGEMGQMVMVMTPWDNPIALTRAWCLIELYACRRSNSSFDVALPPSERVRFLAEIVSRGGAFYDMLSKVNTEHSECSRDSDRKRIFHAVRQLDGGFAGLDRGVLQTMTEWLERQLEEEIADAIAAHRDAAECSAMRALGELLRRKGEYDRALPLYEQCLAKRKRFLGDDHPDTLSTLIELAVVFDRKGEYDRALPLYEECLEKRKKILGDDHPDTILTINELALLFVHKGEYDRALPLYEECLEKRKRLFGDDNPGTLTTINELADLFRKKGQYDRALPLYEECLEKRKRLFGETHPGTLTTLNNLAALFDSRGKYDRALPLYEECLEKRKRLFGDDNPGTLTTLNGLAALFRNKGDYDRALPLYEECLEKRKKILGDDHPNTLSTLNGFAFTLFLKGECARALPLLEGCLVQAKAILGINHDWTILFQTRRDNCALKVANE
jgi:tetratricopeptide (TPR) repeat protein